MWEYTTMRWDSKETLPQFLNVLGRHRWEAWKTEAIPDTKSSIRIWLKRQR